MNEPTDKTIEITCSECETIAVGLDAMISHIIEFHPTYSLADAKDFAQAWLEGAYERYEESERKLTETYQHEKRHRAFWGHR